MSKEKERVIDGQITPLMKQVAEICKEHGIDVVASFGFGAGKFCTTVILGEDADQRLCIAADIILKGFAAVAVRATPAGGATGLAGPSPKGKPS